MPVPLKRTPWLWPAWWWKPSLWRRDSAHCQPCWYVWNARWKPSSNLCLSLLHHSGPTRLPVRRLWSTTYCTPQPAASIVPSIDRVVIGTLHFENEQGGDSQEFAAFFFSFQRRLPPHTSFSSTTMRVRRFRMKQVKQTFDSVSRRVVPPS